VNGIQYALRRIYDGENDITQDLLRMAAKHHTEHEIQHVARDLASWSQEHVRLLARHAPAYGLSLDEQADGPHRVTERARDALSQVIGRRPEPGLLLLEDLRELYLRASQNSLAWEMLAQIAQAKHERELLDLSEECHPQTLRQIRWANTMLKTLSPQVLSSLS
jgi:hypothetical protein